MSGTDYHKDYMMLGFGYGPGNFRMTSNIYDNTFPSVRLRGLPFHVREDEIKLFIGEQTVDILMVKRDGRFSGEAYVVLGSPMQVDMVLTKNKSYMGRRYIEIFRAKKLEYYRAVVAEMTDGPTPVQFTENNYRISSNGNINENGHNSNGFNNKNNNCDNNHGNFHNYSNQHQIQMINTNILKIRGLPYSATSEDVAVWFNESSYNNKKLIGPENVHIVNDFGRSSGTAFVEFESVQEAQAVMHRNREMMGNRYLEIFASSMEERTRYFENP